MRLAMAESKRAITTAICIALSCLLIGCAPSDSFDAKLGRIVKPYTFIIARWEIEALSYEVDDFIFNHGDETADDSQIVLEYFSLNQQISALELQIETGKDSIEPDQLETLKEQLEELQQRKDDLRDGVENVMQQQINEILKELDIFNPLDSQLSLEVHFPPVNFELETPPRLLIISPRDRIARIKEIPLKQDLTLDERDEIEAAVDELGVSSIVVGLGGMATYPSFVQDNTSLQSAIDIAVEEWLHQYLFFRPLGFLYGLNQAGVFKNSDIAVINETIVGIASQEIGSLLYQKYYAPYVEETNQPPASPETDDFDFYEAMREIRIAVDDYLAQGEVEQAEAYMEQQRLFLASKGYYIHQLNQAYFAFYGTYAAGPISVDPLGDELRTLRQQSGSLSDFINKVSNMTSRNDVLNSLE
jgi:hypothetical protein